VEIRNSSFVGQRLPNDSGGAIFFNSAAHAFVVIFNSTFSRNIAKGSGALFAHSKNGSLSLNITNVNFTECASEWNVAGCAILVVVNIAKLTFREIRMHNCFGLYGKCDVIMLMLFNGEVIIKDSSLKNNTQSITGALTATNTGGLVNVTISGCKFLHNFVQSNVVKCFSLYPTAGTLTMVKSVISGQEKCGNTSDAIFASSEFHINLTNIVITSHHYALFINGSMPAAYSEVYPLNVSIYNCTFLKNFRDMVVNSSDPSHVE